MDSRRAPALLTLVIVLAVAQVTFEDAIVFLEATGGLGGGVGSSPFVLVGVSLGLSLALAGTLFGWAILTSETLR